MKVSVVIPAFNEEKLLGACLDSVRAAPLGLARGLGFAIITKAPHYSSGRKFRLYGFWELMAHAFLFLLRPFSSVRKPSRLGVFYEGRR